MIFSENIHKYEKELLALKQKSRVTAYIRIALFIIGAIYIYFFSAFNWIILLAGLVVILLLFLWFVQLSYHLGLKINHLTHLILVNKQEINLMNNDFTDVYTGKDYINNEHKYAYDLDIFGESSIFVLLNRSASVLGQNYLAQKITTPCLDKKEIEKRQKAIAELSDLLEWRQNFQASGMEHLMSHNLAKEKGEYKVKEQNKSILLDWVSTESQFMNNKILVFFIWFMPVITLLSLFASVVSLLPIQIFFLLGILQLTFLAFYLKKINKIHEKTANSAKILSNYSLLLQKIEEQKFESELLIYHQKILKNNTITAGNAIKQLKSIIQLLDNRMNILFAFTFNFLFMWDLHTIIRLEKWQSNYKEKLKDWLDVIKEFDVLQSFAGFAYQQPNFVFPKVSSDEFLYEIINGGHPVIPENERVCNDFKLQNTGSFAIVTGANMAGKSTFLRTTAVNLILGMCGSKVCASNFQFTPIEIFTSIRTNDSLSKNESYFYAELKRLQAIINEIKSGKKLFIIVDEMLRGTNSKDKHYGSKAFIEQIVKYNACGLIATHDVMLGVLEQELNGKITNKRFEVDIKDDKLFFDYKIKDGISQNLNATFLMKKMEIIEK